MKLQLTILLLTFSCLVFAQKPVQPKYTLNGNEFCFDKTYINPSSIDSISVVKTTTPATIQLFLKQPKTSFLTLKDLVKNHTDFSKIDSSMVFFVNDKLMNDISDIRIDESYFTYVEVIYTNNINNISDNLKSLKIIKIDLEKEKREPEIMIRGNNEYSQFLK